MIWETTSSLDEKYHFFQKSIADELPCFTTPPRWYSTAIIHFKLEMNDKVEGQENKSH